MVNEPPFVAVTVPVVPLIEILFVVITPELAVKFVASNAAIPFVDPSAAASVPAMVIIPAPSTILIPVPAVRISPISESTRVVV